ncbi:unnamed protein product [Ceratitis capitata]|uniref:(Mediterranean fruit fly) hypothetical protein n=1 Tax=Ceratitis capitata TaxID=7213 RepID=A0A811TZ29_CERCA|nr:unnamed protein product [Ceratitis capitata]
MLLPSTQAADHNLSTQQQIGKREKGARCVPSGEQSADHKVKRPATGGFLIIVIMPTAQHNDAEAPLICFMHELISPSAMQSRKHSLPRDIEFSLKVSKL